MVSTRLIDTFEKWGPQESFTWYVPLPSSSYYLYRTHYWAYGTEYGIFEEYEQGQYICKDDCGNITSRDWKENTIRSFAEKTRDLNWDYWTEWTEGYFPWLDPDDLPDYGSIPPPTLPAPIPVP